MVWKSGDAILTPEFVSVAISPYQKYTAPEICINWADHLMQCLWLQASLAMTYVAQLVNEGLHVSQLPSFLLYDEYGSLADSIASR